MFDNESHIMTKLRTNNKLGARNKLGRALLESNTPMVINELEFYEMLKERIEWMP